MGPSREPREASDAPLAVTELSDDALRSLAMLHRVCLPTTASARAGLSAVTALYQALLSDDASIVLWVPPPPGLERGGFASGTMRLRATETNVRKHLPSAILLKLALFNLASPGHLLARRRWESTIPGEGIGYILTLGAHRDPSGAGPRGGLLLDALEDRFRSAGAKESWVDTEITNQRALAFYARVGYQRVRRDAGQALLRKVL